tara:strand:- start:425 stop:1147 length:723 start_codon:yes stop_codon:yes gene_type:complete
VSFKLPLFHQSWRQLLFLHWCVSSESIQSRLPEGLVVDTWNGSAYLGIIPFRMMHLRPSFGFPIPAISNFVELNLRTYVRDRYDRSGVWFFSLDTQNVFGNWIAQRFFHLNYRFAQTEFSSKSDKNYRCLVKLKDPTFEQQTFEWQESSYAFMPSKEPDSLECFLTERYRLFSYDQRNRQLFTGQIAHKPYCLNRPILRAYSSDLITDNNFEFTSLGEPNSVLASSGTDVRVFGLERVHA